MVLLVSGDFNAKSLQWGSNVLNARSSTLKQFAAVWDLWPANDGSKPTFAIGNRESVIDVTPARLPRGWSVTDWQVRADLFSDNDRKYIQ